MMTGAAAGDAYRDALAFIAAAVAGDGEAMSAILAAAEQDALTSMLAGLVIWHITNLGADPAEWIAAEQARAVAEISASGGGGSRPGQAR